MSSRIAWNNAKKLCPATPSAAIFSASCLILRLISLVLGCIAQRSLPQNNGAMIFLLGAVGITANALVLAPTEITAMQRLAESLHLLQNSSTRRNRHLLWKKWFALRICADFLVLATVLPSALLSGIALRLLNTVQSPTDGMWALLLSAHLLILSPILFILPLRMRALCAALPLYLLKAPYASISCIFRMSVCATRHRCKQILLRRAACIPLLICPFTALRALPVLCTAELIETSANSDKIIYASSHIRTARKGLSLGILSKIEKSSCISRQKGVS